MPYTLLELHSITGVEIDDRVGFVIHVDPLATQNILSFTVYLSFFSLQLSRVAFGQPIGAEAFGSDSTG